MTAKKHTAAKTSKPKITAANKKRVVEPAPKLVARKPKPAAKRPAQRATGHTSNGLSTERKLLMREFARRKNGSGSTIAQERARQSIEAISVIRRDHIGGVRDAASRKKRYTRRELSSFRDMLLQVREDLVGQVQNLHMASLTRDDGIYSEEDGTDAFDRQLALQLASDKGDSIFEIDEALRRIDEGIYGLCQACGCLTGKPRLIALPFTRLCIECQTATEKHNPQYSHRQTNSAILRVSHEPCSN